MLPQAPPPAGASGVQSLWPTDSEESRAFFQDRLSFLARLVLGMCLGFYVIINVLRTLQLGVPLRGWIERPDNLAHLVTSAGLLLLGILASRGRPSLRALRWLDATGTLVICTLFAVTAYFQDASRADYQALLAVINWLFSRAVLVPSKGLNTFWIGIGSSIPGLVVSYAIYTRPKVASSLDVSPGYATTILSLWFIVAIVVSTVISRVIYGLRREVREAKRLGPYTLEEKIGAGGMGEVYRASHSMLRRPTAIKIVRCDAIGERSLARFEREVQLTSRLTHPNTISIYDYGRTEGGVFYYAMEYLAGVTLEDLVKKSGAQPPGRVVHILRQVCASLSEAHEMGLIHRDIKAANVILCERGGLHDVAKVVDFGLVKDLENLSDVTLSAVNTISGTPHYLSPEAIRSPNEVDGRSDLYAVGVLGYYLLTGKPLFETQSFVEVCSHHLHTAPIPPSVRASVPIPPDLEALILRALEKIPARRPPSARAFQRDLEACASAGEWGEDDARAWWAKYSGRPEARQGPSASDPTLSRAGPAQFSTTDVLSDLQGRSARF